MREKERETNSDIKLYWLISMTISTFHPEEILLFSKNKQTYKHERKKIF